MPSPNSRSFTARNRSRGLRVAGFLAAAGLIAGCRPPPKPVEKSSVAAEKAEAPPVETINALAAQLAGARIDAAKVKLEQQRPDEALALLVSALKADPASGEARALAETILKETVWNL